MAGYKDIMDAIGVLREEVVGGRIEQGKTTQAIVDLTNRLYNLDGDIPEIKRQVNLTNGKVNEQAKNFASLPCRIFCKNKKLWIILAVIILSGGGFLSKETVVSLIGLINGG